MLDSSEHVNVTDSCCVTVAMTWAKHWSTRSRKYRQAENQNWSVMEDVHHTSGCLYDSRPPSRLCFCTSDTEISVWRSAAWNQHPGQRPNNCMRDRDSTHLQPLHIHQYQRQERRLELSLFSFTECHSLTLLSLLAVN